VACALTCVLAGGVRGSELVRARARMGELSRQLRARLLRAAPAPRRGIGAAR